MLWEEGKIHSNKHDEKVCFGSSGVQGETGKERESMVEACKNSKDGAHTKDVMKVRNYVVCVVEYYI